MMRSRNRDGSSSPPRRLAIGESLAGRHNSLNFLRLVLAFTVVAAHSEYVGGVGDGVIHGKGTIGTLAVFGFFGISGYLVGQSADRNSVARYLWQRFLRIFPGFWVCLFVTVVLFGSIGWTHSHHPVGCGITCYFQNRGLPYIGHNFFLRIDQTYIQGTRAYLQYPVFNSPLWTLFYEFLCYLILATLSLTGLLRHRQAVLALTVGIWIAEIGAVITQHIPFDSWDIAAMITLAPVFLTGTLIYLYRDVLTDSGWLALALGALMVASPWIPLGRSVYPHATNYVGAASSVDLFGPAIAYPMLWLGIHLPLQRVGARNDYSYGIYIYAFPVQLVVASWNVQRFGFVAYLLVCILFTLPFAVASWWLVEKRCLKLKKFDPKIALRSLIRTNRPNVQETRVNHVSADETTVGLP
jgi:peptidoglycan/LPS O-acetylase OafA/YrhL